MGVVPSLEKPSGISDECRSLRIQAHTGPTSVKQPHQHDLVTRTPSLSPQGGVSDATSAKHFTTGSLYATEVGELPKEQSLALAWLDVLESR